jgi:hypothetical protein
VRPEIACLEMVYDARSVDQIEVSVFFSHFECVEVAHLVVVHTRRYCEDQSSVLLPRGTR